MFFLPFFVHRMIWGLIELGWLLVWGVCVYNAFNGNRFKLPFIGDFAAKQAGN
jgi:uncharacterized membrane protein